MAFTQEPRGATNKIHLAMRGGRLHSDAQVADAEMFAIYSYLNDLDKELGPQVHTARVLIQSDCLGVLDAVETAWRREAAGLRNVDRGALLENICVLRQRMNRVIFLYTPSHKGIAPNAMADAAAKAHLNGSDPHDATAQICDTVRSRPCLYTINSDYHKDGTLRELGSTAQHTQILWDRRLFPAIRRRVARWVHATLNDGLAAGYVDPHFVGRRGHAVETNKFVAIAVYGVKS